ncbi:MULTISPECIES: hypothetical protein [Kingella]|uniref:Uncharacterized protein n=1 Tax=Kingella bonacorsii TaxID=2796361 RepID=A0ABS1BVN0_9NEIS|nr:MULTISPECIES: hypothetical protein [Kingella]MBK0396925.1 hypothetical protein [Kingella bonacorsii]
MIVKRLCPALLQRQPENQPNGASAARRHFASWQISHALFEAVGDEPSPLHTRFRLPSE